MRTPIAAVDIHMYVVAQRYHSVLLVAAELDLTEASHHTGIRQSSAEHLYHHGYITMVISVAVGARYVSAGDAQRR